jgi:hypothetical protein
MIGKLLALVAAFCVATVTSSACAHWQFTKWGMTEAQVVEASGSAASALSPSEAAGQSTSDGTKLARLGMPYMSGTFQFTATFLFDRAGLLCAVSLKQTAGDADSLRGSLLAKYGQPREHSQTYVGIVDWWNAGADEVMYSSIGSRADVWYEPRSTPDNSGL